MTLGDHTVDGPISCVFLKNQTNIARIANAVQCQKGHYKCKDCCSQLSEMLSIFTRGHKLQGSQVSGSGIAL